MLKNYLNGEEKTLLQRVRTDSKIEIAGLDKAQLTSLANLVKKGMVKKERTGGRIAGYITIEGIRACEQQS